ncbi:MAG: organoarsenical effux MFS transporter ArsJ [Gammaproteobacteria bacterium]|nr:organoarsenical effux MFS transporter ArsJ [Gammaproteobacteria bacterium]
MSTDFRHYLVVTFGYWAFTITDGAIRMLVVLYFHQLGYSPIEIALLFVFYEAFGVATNFIGGWLGSVIGLNRIMHFGMGLQVFALLLLSAPDSWLNVGYVMAVQALSGIAKDLNKMSAKTSVKKLVPENANATLLRWTSVLTGSKNSLKGAGFFVGAFLLSIWGFRGALYALAIPLAVVLLILLFTLPKQLGTAQFKTPFSQLLSRSPAINRLSAARYFLFGARDIWFVVALPVFLATAGWSHTQTGAFLALWIIGYGIVQMVAPSILRRGREAPGGRSAVGYAGALALIPAIMAALLYAGLAPVQVVTFGLILFGLQFALNSALHSYLVLHYADHDKAALDVGFYYMSNAMGRLTGTVLSGWMYQVFGMAGCLVGSCIMITLAALISKRLPS